MAWGIDVIQVRPEPVKRAENGELQSLLPVSPEQPVKQLLTGGINPALLGDWPKDESAGFFVERHVPRHAIYLRGGRKYDPGVMPQTFADDAQVFLEIQLKNGDRIADIFRRPCTGGERKGYIGDAHMVVYPIPAFADVTLLKMKARRVEPGLDAVAVKVSSKHLPVGGIQNPRQKAVTDETIHADDDNFHPWTPVLSMIRLQLNLPAGAGQLRAPEHPPHPADLHVSE